MVNRIDWNMYDKADRYANDESVDLNEMRSEVVETRLFGLGGAARFRLLPRLLHRPYFIGTLCIFLQLDAVLWSKLPNTDAMSMQAFLEDSSKEMFTCISTQLLRNGV